MTRAELERMQERREVYFPPKLEPEPEQKPRPVVIPQQFAFDLYGEPMPFSELQT